MWRSRKYFSNRILPGSSARKKKRRGYNALYSPLQLFLTYPVKPSRLFLSCQREKRKTKQRGDKIFG